MNLLFSSVWVADQRFKILNKEILWSGDQKEIKNLDLVWISYVVCKASAMICKKRAIKTQLVSL